MLNLKEVCWDYKLVQKLTGESSIFLANSYSKDITRQFQALRL